MASKIQIRRDTASNWTATNPTLAQGEPGLETDTGKIKYGDGETVWADLGYAGGDNTTLTDSGAVTVTAGSTDHWVAGQRRNNNDTYGRGVRHDSNGNVYTLTQTYDGNSDVGVVTKYTPNGNVEWQWTIDELTPYSLAVDSSDCVYIAGEGNDDNVHVWKLDTDGTVLWKKSYDAGNWTGECFIEERTSTRLALVANRNNGDYGVLVLDINMSTGAVETQKLISLGEDNVWCTGIDTDADGNVFVTGRYNDTGAGKYKMFVEKFDSNLDRVWSKSIETSTSDDMQVGDCASDSLGNVYAVAYYDVDVNNNDGNNTETAGVLIKLNSSGTTQWTRRLGPGPCGLSVVGLTATDLGDVYLATTTLEYNRDPQLDDYDQFATGIGRMIVARYNTSGEVIWQRYVDASHVWESGDTFRGQTISVYDDKFVVDFYGTSSNTVPWNLSGTADDESDFFVVQLPVDGTELEIGDVAFRASRIPGRFVTHETTASPLANDVFGSNVTVATSTLTIDSEIRIANALITSETYDYVFGADGTLTIPNDGDIKLTQTQTGWLGVLGGSVNFDDDVEGRAVTADAEGNTYAVGHDSNNNSPYVVKFSPEGHVLWSVTIEEDSNGYNGQANGVALDPTTGNVVVICEIWGSYYYGAKIVIDQDTGRILSNVEYKDSSNDVYFNDIAFLSTGDWVIGGSKNGNFTAEETVSAQAGSTTQKIVVLRSDVTGTVTTNWQINGTGFSGFENIASVEQYSNLTSTVVQGSGANFAVADNGDTTYAVGTIVSPGTSYKIGHKILVLGTDLGGATPFNDCVVRVTDVDGSGGIVSLAVDSGTAAGGAYTLFTPVSGTNYQTGSGFSFSTFNGPLLTSSYSDQEGYNINSYGADYVVGDVIKVLGTDLGGTTPANDLIITVDGIGGSGEANNYTFSGTAQSTNWNITTYTSVDFSQEGNWTFTAPLSRENILITADWQRTYGTVTNDETDHTYAIAVDSGDNILVATEGYGETGGGSTYNLAVVYKFNSSGTLQWARKLNTTNYYGYAVGITTVGTDVYATHTDDDGYAFVTKLSANGTIKWQRRLDDADWDIKVVAADDGNILVADQGYHDDIGDDAFRIFKLTPSGETVYKRWLLATTDDDTRFDDGRGLAVVGNKFYTTGYYNADDYNSAFVSCLPIDGSGTGEYGQFSYTDVNAQTGNYNYPSLTGVNYDITEIASGDSLAGALTTDPYVNSASLDGLQTEGNYYVDSFFPTHNYEQVVDTDGGNIIFADGTTQNTSATDIPQRLYHGQRYTLGLRDRGHHIYCRNSEDWIMIPYDARVPFPVGSVITIVNDTGSNVYIGTEGGGTNLFIAGTGYYGSVSLLNYGIATLLKVGREKWVISGNVESY